MAVIYLASTLRRYEIDYEIAHNNYRQAVKGKVVELNNGRVLTVDQAKVMMEEAFEALNQFIRKAKGETQ